MKAILCAGGGGTRLWPVSTNKLPKQFQRLIGDKSLFENTLSRLRPVFSDSDIVVITGAVHADTVKKMLDGTGVHLIVEPERRETLGAIGTAVAYITRENPNETFVNINVDAHILDVPEYLNVLQKLDEIVNASKEKLTLVGLRPTYPETGYGYIEIGEPVTVGGHSIHKVRRFKEKPDLDTAKDYVRSGSFLWNPTMVCGTAKCFMNAVFRHEPEVHSALRTLIEADDFHKQLPESFAIMPKQTVDYGILEREPDMNLLPAEFGWTDIGSWRTIHDRGIHDADANVIEGDAFVKDVKGSLVRNDTDRFVAVVGLDDIVVIETKEGTLVMHKDHAQDVKKIAEHFEKKDR